MAITMTELAKRLNLSQSTVSLVLNNRDKGRVRERIRQEASATGFRLNRAASDLRRRRSNTIGVALAYSNNFYRAELVTALHAEIVRRGYRPLFAFFNNDMEQRSATRLLLDNNLDAIITLEPQWLPDHLDLPVVSLFHPDPRFDAVLQDADHHIPAVRQHGISQFIKLRPALLPFPVELQESYRLSVAKQDPGHLRAGDRQTHFPHIFKLLDVTGIEPAGSAQPLLPQLFINITQILFIQEGTALLPPPEHLLLPADLPPKPCPQASAGPPVPLQRPVVDHNGPPGAAGILAPVRGALEFLIIIWKCIQHTLSHLVLLIIPQDPRKNKSRIL